MRGLIVLGLVATLVGCEATIPDDVFACGAGETCPPSFECVDGFCRRNGERDASVDATTDTAIDSTVDSTVDSRLDSATDAMDAGVDVMTDGGECPCTAPNVCVVDTCCREVTMVAGNDHTICVISALDELFCWGDNTHNQIGGGAPSIEVPSQVTGGSSRWDFVDTNGGVGSAHTCAISDDAELYCWGDNFYGQLGLGNMDDREMPALVGGTGWTDVTVADQSTCGIRSGGLYCWGRPLSGRLGISPTPAASVLTPTQIATSSAWTDVDCDGGTCCAIRDDMQVFCWGDNAQGQAGTGTPGNIAFPVQIGDALRATDVSCGKQHCCVVSTSDQVFCWGAGNRFQLGVSTQDKPDFPTLAGASEVSAGAFHTCAILVDDDDVSCWGNNEFGQLGSGGTSDRLMPEPVGTVADLIALGADHTCAVDPEGRLRCWGLDPGSGGMQTTPSLVCVPPP